MVLDQLVGDLIWSADGGRARIVVVMLPRNQRTVSPDARLDLNHTGRAEIPPGEFLAARPHHLHGPAGRLGQASGFNSRLAGMLAAIPASHIRSEERRVGKKW